MSKIEEIKRIMEPIADWPFLNNEDMGGLDIYSDWTIDELADDFMKFYKILFEINKLLKEDK